MHAVDLAVREHVAIVRFSSPPVNFFSRRLLDEIADAMDEAVADGARAIVLGSEGKHFCAGADFSAMGSSAQERAAEAAATYEAGLRILDQPVPVIAAVQGAAVGGGLGLACVADFRVVAPDTRFEPNFSRLGFHPGFGLSATLPAIIGTQRAATLFYLSRKISGAEAVELGLADRIADDGDIVAVAAELGGELAAQAPLAVRSIKETLRGQLRERVRDVLPRELAEQRRLWATNDAAAGIRAARERTSPVFSGS
jgi:enoyl-CoA hydratase/carnithine racemase